MIDREEFDHIAYSYRSVPSTMPDMVVSRFNVMCDYVDTQIAAAVLAERDACARLCNDVSIRYPLDVFPDTGELTGNSAKMARITAATCAREIILRSEV